MLYTIINRLTKLFVLTAMALFLLALILPQTAQAEGGIAVSGSFSRHHFKLLPSESIDTPHIDVVFFNNYDRDIKVQLTPRLPEGVQFHLDEYQIAIPADSNIKIPIGLTVGKDVIPGDYDIGLAADVLPDAETGIAIVGSAELRTKLSVYGEAGTVNIKTVTAKEEPFPAVINLSLKEGNSLSPAGYSNRGQLNERLVPGDYVAIAYWEGTEVASEQFTLAADEEKEITLAAQTVFINGFTVSGGEDKGSARLTYTIDNIYRPLSDVRLVLNVFHRGKLLEELEMFTIPLLEVGSLDNRFNYIPAQGWQPGEYVFRIDLVAEDDLVYAQSRDQIIEIKGWPFELFATIGMFGGPLFFGLFLLLLWKRRKCRKCRGKGFVKCISCQGQGYNEINGLKKTCFDCAGSGVVPCQECKNKKKKK